MLDVVTLGDAMVGFAPPGQLRLEQAGAVEVWPTGAEANAAVLMARLGLRVGWFSKLPEHPLSRLIVRAVRAHGVDTSRVVWTPEGRLGTFFYERSVPPRPSRVWYDRQGSAFTTMAAQDVDWPYLASARAVLVAGTAPALGPGLRDLTLQIARETRAAGNLFALDVNFRAKLWPAEEASRYFAQLLPHVSLLFCGRADAARVFGLSGTPEAAAGAFRERFGISVVVLTQGAEGAIALADRIYRQRQVPRTQVVDAVGAGDAFAGGFLCGYLEGGVQRGLDWGGGAGALACTIVGDFAVVTRAELEELLASGEQEIQR